MLQLSIGGHFAPPIALTPQAQRLRPSVEAQLADLSQKTQKLTGHFLDSQRAGCSNGLHSHFLK